MSSKKSLKQRNELSFEWRIISAFDGLSLNQIAAKLDIKEKTFWNWAMQRTQMPNEVLAKIGTETGISLNWLLTGKGERFTVEKKDFTVMELVEKVNEKSSFFSLDIFIYELAKINPDFRRMLNDISYKHAERAVLTMREMFDAWDDEYEERRKTMYDYINSKPEMVKQLKESNRKIIESKIAEPKSIQDLGNIDQFDVEASVAKHDTLEQTLEDWYRFEGKEIPEGFGLNFGGWEKLSLEDKIQTAKDVKEFADKMNEKIDRGELDDD